MLRLRTHTRGNFQCTSAHLPRSPAPATVKLYMPHQQPQTTAHLARWPAVEAVYGAVGGVLVRQLGVRRAAKVKHLTEQ